MEFNSPGSVSASTVNISAFQDANTGMTFHKVNITLQKSTVMLQLIPPRPEDTYMVYLRNIYTPTLSKYDYKTLAVRTQDGTAVTVTIPSSEIKSTGIHYIGLLPEGNTTGTII